MELARCPRQTKASRLWAWLGYVIPLAGYWFPAHNLRQLVDGAAPDATRLRTLILAWGIARNLASPLVVIIVVYGLYRLGPTSNVTAGIAAVYMLLSFIAANLLSLIMISQVRRYLDTGAVDERHAEVFT